MTNEPFDDENDDDWLMYQTGDLEWKATKVVRVTPEHDKKDDHIIPKEEARMIPSSDGDEYYPPGTIITDLYV